MVPHTAPEARAQPPEAASPLSTLIAAGLFLYVGFGLGLTGATNPEGFPVYHWSIVGFVWTGRVVGIGLLLLAGLEFAGLRQAALLDALLAGVAALMCAAVGAVWIAHGDTQGWLIVLFALVNAMAARGAWQRFCWSVPAVPPGGGDSGPSEP